MWATVLPFFLLIAISAKSQTGGDELDRIKVQAEAGDMQSQFKLAEQMNNASNQVEALIWYRKAALQNMISAQERMGAIFIARYRQIPATNEVVKEATGREAYNWLIQAAAHNSHEAQLELATMYNEGDVVHRDYIEAYKWAELVMQHPIRLEVRQRAKAIQDNCLKNMSKEQLQDAIQRIVTIGLTWTNNVQEEPSDIRVSNISGTDQKRFAIINNHTFTAGDCQQIKIYGSNIKVRCLEVRKRSVVIQIDGASYQREIPLSSP